MYFLLPNQNDLVYKFYIRNKHLEFSFKIQTELSAIFVP